ncbi:MAG: hypothetical protein WAQ98_24940, partial [Blastocatellia bacterium]
YGWVWVPDGINNFWSPALVSWYYGSWNGNNYICWSPRNWDNWPTGGGGGWVPPQEPGPGKPTRPHPILKNEPLVAGGSALPIDAFTGGNTNPQNHPLANGIKVVKQIETINLPKPSTSTSTNNIALSKLPSDILISRPLVSKFGAIIDDGNGNGPRRRYETPRTSDNGSGIVGTSTGTITTTAPVTPVKNPRSVRNVDDTPIVRTNDAPLGNSNSGGSKGNNGNSGNSGNSGSSGSSNKPSASEGFGRGSQPTVNHNPSPSVSRDSSPSISSPSRSVDSSPSRGGGGRNRND